METMEKIPRRLGFGLLGVILGLLAIGIVIVSVMVLRSRTTGVPRAVTGVVTTVSGTVGREQVRYKLMGATGAEDLYLVANPGSGINLADYVGKSVDVTGTVVLGAMALPLPTMFVTKITLAGGGPPPPPPPGGSTPALFGVQVVGTDDKLPSPALVSSMNIKATVLWLYYPGAGANLAQWVTNEKKLVEGVQSRTGIFDVRVHIMPNDPTRQPAFHMPADMATYTRALTALAQALAADGVKYYSIGNEFSGYTWAGTIDDYKTLLSESGRAIKAGNPNALILDSGMAGETYVFAVANSLVRQGDLAGALSFVQAFLAHHTSWNVPTTVEELKAGLASAIGQDNIAWHQATFTKFCPYYDVFEFHGYQGWETMAMVFNWIQTQMRQNNCVKPIQFWEMGYGLDLKYQYDLAQQARSVGKMLTIAAAQSSQLIHYFPFKGTGNYARGLTAFTDDFQLLPAGIAFKVATGKLSGATFRRTLALGNNVAAYQFNRNGKSVYVLWTAGNATVGLPGVTGQVTVTDISGSASSQNASSISVSDSPIFVE